MTYTHTHYTLFPNKTRTFIHPYTIKKMPHTYLQKHTHTSQSHPEEVVEVKVEEDEVKLEEDRKSVE